MPELKISIITPCLNAGKSIRHAIKSVLAQTYQNWEHIIVDGGSTDDTLAIVSEYPHLKVILGPDKGQADAMNKGALAATGDIIGFLNADDHYFAEAFERIAVAFDDQTDLVMGNVLVKSKRRNTSFLNRPKTTLKEMLCHWEVNAFCYNPVGYFYRPSLQRRCPFNTDNYESMDLEFLLAAVSFSEFKKIDFTLGCFEDGLGTVTDRTQLMPDYWRPSRFPYINQYMRVFSPIERLRYENDRRAGYIRLQNDSNRRALRRKKPFNTDARGRDRISIVIPAIGQFDKILNAVRYLATCNRVTRVQTVILADDLSAERLAVELKRYVKDSRVVLGKVNNINSSWDVKNAALEFAGEPFIFFARDSEDICIDTIVRLLSIAIARDVDIVQVSPLRSARQNLKFSGAYDFASDGGIDGLEFLALGKLRPTAQNKLFSRKALGYVGQPAVRDQDNVSELIFASRSAYLAGRIVSVSDPGLKSNHHQKFAKPELSVYGLLRSYFAACVCLENSLAELGLDNDTISRLAPRILHAEGNSDFGSRVVKLYSQIGPNAFNAELQFASRELLGVKADSIAALIQSLIDEVARASDCKRHSGLLLAVWRYFRDNAVDAAVSLKKFGGRGLSA